MFYIKFVTQSCCRKQWTFVWDVQMLDYDGARWTDSDIEKNGAQLSDFLVAAIRLLHGIKKHYCLILIYLHHIDEY